MVARVARGHGSRQALARVARGHGSRQALALDCGIDLLAGLRGLRRWRLLTACGRLRLWLLRGGKEQVRRCAALAVHAAFGAWRARTPRRGDERRARAVVEKAREGPLVGANDLGHGTLPAAHVRADGLRERRARPRASAQAPRRLLPDARHQAMVARVARGHGRRQALALDCGIDLLAGLRGLRRWRLLTACGRLRLWLLRGGKEQVRRCAALAVHAAFGAWRARTPRLGDERRARAVVEKAREGPLV